MKAEDALNATQQTLRVLVMALATEAKVDKGRLGLLLNGLADSPGLMPEAQTMLRDLATGLVAAAPPGGLRRQ